MRNVNPYLPRALPGPVEGLAALALDLRWSWNRATKELWREVDAHLWEATENPWLILESVSQRRLETLAKDQEFCALLERQLDERRRELGRRTWFARTHAPRALGRVAYFSMEFGLGEALPIYSGGLGILAGDHLKAASDLGVPIVGVGLLYQRGYFRQTIDASGEQLELYPYSDPVMLPVVPARDPGGEWVHVPVELPGRTLDLRAWEVTIGRVRLFLLDSNDPLNAPADRGITGDLYGGGPEMRLQQELVLGIGGWRLLGALGLECEVCHMNEGHAAFVVLERAREFMERSGQPFAVALRATRAGNLFTTHTAVAAGFDRFAPELVRQYLGDYAGRLGLPVEELLALGRSDPRDSAEPFTMAHLAVRGSGYVNAVSRLHEAVTRRIFEPLFPRWPEADLPVGHITNGVHVPSWHSGGADALWSGACGEERWLGDLETVEQDLRRVRDEDLWSFRRRAREALVEFVRARLGRQTRARGAGAAGAPDPAQVLDPDVLTLGFARRFAAYKRPNLLLHDEARLLRLLTNPERPVQLIVAGKAHPHDAEGKRLVRGWSDFMRRSEVGRRCVFLEDYDMALAARLVQGVDVWINTPRRPWEASGTSGMKVLANGGLNLSELDGWWAEAYAPEVGWALGDGREHDADPAWDAAEAEALYTLLEREVVPAFYTRDGGGIPRAWVARVRESMACLTPRFSTNRMTREYTRRYYVPGSAAVRRRMADGAALARRLEQWHAAVARAWPAVRFGSLLAHPARDTRVFQVEVHLGDLDPEAVRVELYAEERGAQPAVRHPMRRVEQLPGAANAYRYEATLPSARPAGDFTPRLVPVHADASVPLEAPEIVWQH